MSRILSFGSLNIDYVYSVDHFVRKGETLSSDRMHVSSGGKGLNQSCALGKAGCQVYHAGIIGTDGLFLLDVLKQAKVDTSLIRTSNEIQTGNTIIQNDKEGDNCILLYGGANQAIEPEFADSVLSHFSRGDVIILQNEISSLEYIITKAASMGMTTIFNPSPYNEKITPVVLGAADWLIMNETEAMGITGSVSEEEQVLVEHLRMKFPDKKIVLTLGERGSCFISSDFYCHQDIFKVHAVDTTAAGDTFTGYFVASILRGEEIPEALLLAAKASAIAVTRAGASPSIPWMEEVESKR